MFIGAISKGILLPSLVANSLLILDMLVQLYFVFIFSLSRWKSRRSEVEAL